MYKYNENKHSDYTENTSHGLILKYIKRGDKVLEFGCGTGVFASYLKEKLACRVYGIEISREAVKAAKSVLDKTILANAEEDGWKKELRNERFDAIVFADVLEHLREPERVLCSVKEFLEPGGKVIFSVPNVAHADIIAKLLRGKFEYTDIGLLDSTHIHFFAKESLVPFCKNAGFTLSTVEGTTVPVGFTEQKPDEERFIFDYLNNFNCHNVYQFVCVAYPDEYAEANAITLDDRLICTNPVRSTLYYDFGRGFSEDNKLIIDSALSDTVSFEVKLPQGVKRVRIDVVDGKCYVIKERTVLLNGEKVEPSFVRNVLDAEQSEICLLDPQYIIDVGDGENTVKVFAKLYPFVDMEGTLLDMLSRLLEMKDEWKNEAHSAKSRAEALSESLEVTEKMLSEYKKHYAMAIEQRDALAKESANYRAMYENVANAFFWKITKPFRFMLDVIKKIIKKIPFLYKFFRGLKCLKQNGFKYTVRKIKYKLKNRKRAAYLAEAQYTEAELAKQRAYKFSRDIKFSITVPLYNTPEKYLVSMIESVRNQTYSNWELCLADGSDSEHKGVYDAVKKYAKTDSRIKYRRLEKNLGISGNTNACLEMATGDYIALFDHDDLLHSAALYEVMKAICDEDADFIYTDENTFHHTPSDAFWPHFKPDFSPDTLRSYNYICHLSVFSRELLSLVGGFRSEFDGSQDYDMILRLTEKAKKIVHIPKVLYYWRAHENSVAQDITAKPYTITAAKAALSEHLTRLGLKGEVLDSAVPSTYRIKYEIDGQPLVSIIIPTKDHTDDLDKCIRSIEDKSTYKNYELIIVENNSTEPLTFSYYEQLKSRYSNVNVVTWEGEFNYSKINNFGVNFAKGEYLILLNNDIEILTPSWIEEMLMFVSREDVGCAGMKLYYPDDTVQHAGVILGIGGVAGHSHKYFPRADFGYASRLTIAQNLSACTAAALMVRRSVFDEVGGLDEGFAVAFNDVDFCMKIRERGYLIVFTPYAEAYHYESKSRGLENTPEKVKRFNGECNRFFSKWQDVLDRGDPYYNPNLTLEREDFTVR